MNRFLTIIKRDLRLNLRQGGDGLMMVMFFLLVCIMFPLGIGPEHDILASIAPGIIWVAALLASMLSLDRLFLTDYEDGSLELLVITPIPLECIVIAKIIAHWFTTSVPLIIATPLLAILLNLHEKGFQVLIFTLLLGTPTLSLIGAIGAALVLGSKRGSVLLFLLILPLYIPVLIFGVSAANVVMDGFEAKAQLAILGGILACMLLIAPFACAVALRQAIE